MSTGATLAYLLVATIVGVDAENLDVNAGYVNGLRLEDRGQIYYVLKVGDQNRRVDVGDAEVVALGVSSSSLRYKGEKPVRPAFRVSFEIPSERLAPATMLAEAPAHLGTDEARVFTETYLARFVEYDPDLEVTLRTLLEDRQAGVEALAGSLDPHGPDAAEDQKIVRTTVAATLLRIGLPLTEAKFFNQHPPFEADVDSFTIDVEPVTQLPAKKAAEGGSSPVSSVSYREAEAYCRNLEGRLPSEVEWEAALSAGAIETVPGYLEWTSSWYQPFPGNNHPEDDYGERFKVLKGARSVDDPDRHLRRYLDPNSPHPMVSFRCVFATGE